MATKTISVDLQAYDRLVEARLRPDESFSRVIKRARWEVPDSTGASLLIALEECPPLADEELERMEAAQKEDQPGEDKWKPRR